MSFMVDLIHLPRGHREIMAAPYHIAVWDSVHISNKRPFYEATIKLMENCLFFNANGKNELSGNRLKIKHSLF